MKLLKNIKEWMQEEEGAIMLIAFPYICIMGVFLFYILINMMWASETKYHVQLMIDNASRAGAQAVDFSYSVKERSGQGKGNYHVYVELDEAQAKANANKVLDAYKNDLPNFTATKISFNESGTVSPVWNSNLGRYQDRVISPEKQYQNGNFTVRIKGTIPAIGHELYHGSETIKADQFSQSIARGSLTDP